MGIMFSYNAELDAPYIKISKAAFYAIYYILASDTKKIYSFRIDDKAEKELEKIADRLYIEQISF